jgi:hypothetical protein
MKKKAIHAWMAFIGVITFRWSSAGKIEPLINNLLGILHDIVNQRLTGRNIMESTHHRPAVSTPASTVIFQRKLGSLNHWHRDESVQTPDPPLIFTSSDTAFFGNTRSI